MADYHINIFYSEEDGGYVADIPDLECCSAFGQTPEEALAEVERAKEAWLQAAREAGRRGTWVLVPTNDTYAHVSDMLEGSKPGYLPRFLVFDLQGGDPDGYRELYMHAPQQMAALALLRWGIVPVV